MADYPALSNLAIGLFCADHFFSEGDTLEDMASPVVVAAAEAERYSEKLKVPGSRLMFFLRCLYAAGFNSGMAVYRVALAGVLDVPQEAFDARFTAPDFHLDKKAARRAVNLLNSCSAEEIMNACPGFGFAEKEAQTMTNERAQQLAAMLTAKQRADIVQLAAIITAPAAVPPEGATAPARR